MGSTSHLASDYAELARLNQVSRARTSQIMNLLHLAPDIQEAILNLPEVEYVRDEVGELRVRAIASVADWERLRRMWAKLLVRSGREGRRHGAEVAGEK